jgi:hypothetical protein
MRLLHLALHALEGANDIPLLQTEAAERASRFSG